MTSAASNEVLRDDTTFEQFCEEWLIAIEEPGISAFEKGQRFAYKLVTQWLDVVEGDEDLELLDGTGDGGIDIAYLDRPDLDETDLEDNPDNPEEGHIWYLIQSKFGTSFRGYATIVSEGQKAISTLAGENTRISDRTRQFLSRLNNFKSLASERDRIVLVFATDQPIDETDRRALDAIRNFGIEQFGPIFDVEDVSLKTIWDDRTADTITLPIKGRFAETDLDSGLCVGAIPLTDLYEFLKEYDVKTGSLDQLYEKNVRQFLGGRRKINRGIKITLENNPEAFGLYNNGITIVAADITNETGGLILQNPYIVNGCQTTKTIWAVLREKLDSGGTGQNTQLTDWRARADKGVVLAKIVKSDHAQIPNITRYTNSQNAVREQDFLTLEDEFQAWASAMAERFDIFLEIQRGGWDSRRAFQKRYPSVHQFKEYANAFDLIKVYGAGWLREPGSAFGRSAPFLPGGDIYGRVTKTERISTDDLYAAFRLQKSADQFNFGRGATVKPSRRQTRFLYYFVVVDMLRDALSRGNSGNDSRSITEALNILFQDGNKDVLQELLNASMEVIDEYVNEDSDESVFNEPGFQGNLNTFVKREQLAKDLTVTPHLSNLLGFHKIVFGRSSGAGSISPRQRVLAVIGSPVS